ncbi:hypothetical protein C8F04DRAFT_1232560 [Mycena alexandri]|uniref:Uncharacterized protein n=1 Tax=Mycena alexandri TaxID=1745969 RepID=A0AAD6T2V3_9AGAR|nr:hypothetical protein C8F04DRAFT_1232560 [Mycena alexandri]
MHSIGRTYSNTNLDRRSRTVPCVSTKVHCHRAAAQPVCTMHSINISVSSSVRAADVGSFASSGGEAAVSLPLKFGARERRTGAAAPVPDLLALATRPILTVSEPETVVLVLEYSNFIARMYSIAREFRPSVRVVWPGSALSVRPHAQVCAHFKFDLEEYLEG